jgi:hypothetical protein
MLFGVISIMCQIDWQLDQSQKLTNVYAPEIALIF